MKSFLQRPWQMLKQVLASPIARIAIGLVSLAICVTLFADAVFGVFRDDQEVARQIRKRVSENISVQIAVLAQRADVRAIEETLAAIMSREPDVMSVGVRRADDVLMYSTPSHGLSWKPLEDNKSTLTHVLVPLSQGKEPWGQIEIIFRPVGAQGWAAWLSQPAAVTALSLLVLGFVGYYLYMRKVLNHLDPTQAIPERVGVAMDTLAEGVMILDVAGRILLANREFHSIAPDKAISYIGKKASEIAWFSEALGPDKLMHPWSKAVRTKKAMTGLIIDLQRANGNPRKIVINASPVLDNKGAVRGCIVSMNDVTELHSAIANLQLANDQLQEKQDEIESKNRELERLAYLDPLTGCLNRRAFMDRAMKLVTQAQREGTHISVVMTDIDKFKNFNDTYGHSLGDEVIQQTARVLSMGLRPTDLLCRYGGEEFCIVLPGMELAHAAVVAERLREKMESQAGQGVRSVPGLRVTASFGVSDLALGAMTLQQLIEEADTALYAAKQAGRNFVCQFSNAPLLSATGDPKMLAAMREIAEAIDLSNLPAVESENASLA